MKLKNIVLIILIFSLVLLISSPSFAKTRSLIVMHTYNFYYQGSSIPKISGINLEVPVENMNYYPLLITFNSNEGMSSWLSTDVNFTVEFTFADFNNGRSGIYDVNSPLYNSYLGVYYLEGFKQKITESIAHEIVEYDIRKLALPALGLPSHLSIFEIDGEITKTNDNINGLVWDKYLSKFKQNGPEHNRKKFLLSYLQFGSPPESISDYPVREMYGVLYTRYDINKDINICIYATAKDKTILTNIENEVIKKSEMIVQ